MKRIFLVLSMTASMVSGYAQVAPQRNYDEMRPPFCIDLNITGGYLDQRLRPINLAAAYPDHIQEKTVISQLEAGKGQSYGFDAQFSWFPDKKHHFGIGTGIRYLSQTGSIIMDSFHVEYRSIDYNKDTFRQLLTANHPVSEDWKITNISIPVLLKYKYQVTKKLGVTAEAGILYNVRIRNSYQADASFDYEAIYKFITDHNGESKPTYDNAVVPADGDWLITREKIHHDDPNKNPASYFDSTSAQGYNVCLDKKPVNTSGTTSFSPGSIGFMLQAGLSYKMSYRISLNLAAYYSNQPFKNKGNEGYMITDKVGDYNSMAQGLRSDNFKSYGLNLGIRYYLGRGRDGDGDGVTDINDLCPGIAGLPQYDGCPDSDGDGTPDRLDNCPETPGPVELMGCPDKDGDGITDKEDECPGQKGTRKAHGCPDKDGDGIADDRDKCPDQAGTALLDGCPSREERNQKYAAILKRDGITIDTATNDQYQSSVLKPANHVLLSTNTIHFDLKSAKILPRHAAHLDEAIEVMNKNPDIVMAIGGYTDENEGETTDMPLSYARANAVKQYLVTRGIDADRLIISGYGHNKPADADKLPRDKARNRRVTLRLLLPL